MGRQGRIKQVTDVFKKAYEKSKALVIILGNSSTNSNLKLRHQKT